MAFLSDSLLLFTVELASDKKNLLFKYDGGNEDLKSKINALSTNTFDPLIYDFVYSKLSIALDHPEILTIVYNNLAVELRNFSYPDSTLPAYSDEWYDSIVEKLKSSTHKIFQYKGNDVDLAKRLGEIRLNELRTHIFLQKALRNVLEQL
jgi:hypothetical protein